MELKSYEIKCEDGETLLKPMGEKRFLRLTDISGYYTKEAIETQIEKGIWKEADKRENKTPRIIGCRRNYSKYVPLSPYQKTFFAKMYRTGQLKQKSYSQMWRYKEDAAKFEQLQSQYLYLYRHGIRSVEELKDRKEFLHIRMDALDEKRKQIYKKRYSYKPALALLKIIEENETRASYYKEGSIFYAPNYEKWREAAEALVRQGYTIGQITEIKEAFQAELATVTKVKRELKKEENLINGILHEKSRVQVMEITAPEAEAPSKTQESTKEADAKARSH